MSWHVKAEETGEPENGEDRYEGEDEFSMLEKGEGCEIEVRSSSPRCFIRGRTVIAQKGDDCIITKPAKVQSIAKEE